LISTSAETLISVAMLSEIKSRMGREADDFIVAVGERIGAACSFDFNGGLEPFTVALNDIWAELGFGKAHLSMERGALLISSSGSELEFIFSE